MVICDGLLVVEWNLLDFDKSEGKKHREISYFLPCDVISVSFQPKCLIITALQLNEFDEIDRREIRSIRQQQCNDKNNGIIYFIGRWLQDGNSQWSYNRLNSPNRHTFRAKMPNKRSSLVTPFPFSVSEFGPFLLPSNVLYCEYVVCAHIA